MGTPTIFNLIEFRRTAWHWDKRVDAGFLLLDATHVGFEKALGEYLAEGIVRMNWLKEPAQLFRDTMLVVHDNPCGAQFPGYRRWVSDMVELLAGNGASVLGVELSRLSEIQRMQARAVLARQLEPRLQGRKNTDGKLVDVETLLSKNIMNIFAVLDESKRAKPATRVVHQSEKEYAKRVGKLVDAAQANYSRGVADEAAKTFTGNL